MNSLFKNGFTENFMVKEEGLCNTNDCDKFYSPSEVIINNFYRFEGESDPADNAILYAIVTSDGSKGLLSDSYGAYADEYVAKFIADVEDINKRTNREGKV